MRIRVVGVHPVEVPEPCHLIELSVRSESPQAVVAAITQEVPGEPRENWQAPWGERVLDAHRTREAEAANCPDSRIVFFFHYLDFERPLLTPTGPLTLPDPTTRPKRLDFIEYEAP